jgi:hypothetical protein
VASWRSSKEKATCPVIIVTRLMLDMHNENIMLPLLFSVIKKREGKQKF